MGARCMSRLRSVSPPTFPRKYRQSGQAVVTLTDPTGRQKDYLLGRYGSAESHITGPGLRGQ